MKEICKKQLITIYKIVFNLYYTLCSCFKKNNEKKAVFILSRSDNLEGNLKYIYKALINQADGIKIHFVHTQNKMNLKLFREASIISNAKYLIIDDYYLPIYLIKPYQHLKVIQLWHAAGAFKKFGYSTVGKKFGPKTGYLKSIPVHSNYTHVYVSSKNIIPYYAEAFDMPQSNIYPLGIPRVDFFNDENEKHLVTDELYSRYPNLKDNSKINILFAPTYRATGKQKETNLNIVAILLNIMQDINDNINICFKPHPYMNSQVIKDLNSYANITISNEFSLNEWMLLADAFITDYSSAIFEFSLLKRPLAHYVPDINEYRENRGFYQDIELISDGTIIRDQKSLVQWINTRKKGEYYNTTHMINKNFDNITDVSKKIVTHFISN